MEKEIDKEYPVLEENSHKNLEKQPNNKDAILKKREWKVILLVVVFVVGIGLLFIGGFYGWKMALKRAITYADQTYKQTLAEQREETYQEFYQTSFDFAEEKHHVSNSVTITIEDIREQSQLEVLQVSGVEYIYDKADVKKWTAVWGRGVYTVDLKMSEFVVDNERYYVLARVPFPQLNTAALDYKWENYLFEDGIFNGSKSEGVDLARQDLQKAQNQLREKLSSTQSYYKSAEESAEKMIISLVKSLNPDVEELVVEVEFVD